MAEVRIGVNVDANGAVKSFKLISTGAKEAGKDAASLGQALERELKIKVESMAGSMGPFGNILRSLGPAGIVATAGIGALAGAAVVATRAVARLASEAERLQNMAKVTGMEAAELQRLGRTAENLGGTLDATIGSISKMELALARNSKALRAAGVDVDALRAMKPGEAFETLARQIAATEDPFKRAQISAAAFGLGWKEILPLLLKVGTEGTDAIVTMSDQQLTALGDVDDAIDDLIGSWTDLKNQMLAGFAEMSGPAGIGMLAQGFRGIAQYLKESDLWDVIRDAAGGKTLHEMIQASMRATLYQGRRVNNAAAGIFQPGSIATPDPLEALALMEREQRGIFATLDARQEAWARLIGVLKNQRPIDFRDAVHPGMGALMGTGIATSLNLSENRVVVGGQPTNLMGSLMGLGPATSLQIGYFQELALARQRKLTDEAARWQNALQGVALVAGAVGGKLGETLQVVENIGHSFKGWKTMTGLDRFNVIASSVGQIGGLVGGKGGSFLQGAAGGAMAGAALGSIVPGIGTVAGGVVGGIIGGIGGLFGAGKREREEREKEIKQFEEMTEQLRRQHGSLEEAARLARKYGVDLREALDSKKPKELEAALELVERRMKGLETHVAGLKLFMDNLTFLDAEGQIQQTFFDPAMAETSATLFSLSFWEIWRRQGIGAIEELRPQWEAMLENLGRLGLDPAALGLGSIGRLFDLTADPRTKALLGVSQGAGQMLRGAMEGGFLSDDMLAAQTDIARGTLTELQAQGLTQEEAAQAMADQLAALAQASQLAGQELPADLKAAMEAAGITVLPTQLEVLKEIRDILRGGPAGVPAGAGFEDTQMDRFSSAAGYGYFLPKRVQRDGYLRFHGGEGLLVVPRHLMAISAAGGFGREGGGDGEGRGPRHEPGGGLVPGGGTGGGGGGVSGGGGSGSTIQDLERAVIDLGRRPTAAVTFAPQTTVMADPLQTKEGLRQLQDAAIEKVYEELDKQSPAFIARLERAGFRRTSS